METNRALETNQTVETKPKKNEFGWLDVLAFTIAAYQVILPILFMFFGVVLGIYLLLWLWAGS